MLVIGEIAVKMPHRAGFGHDKGRTDAAEGVQRAVDGVERNVGHLGANTLINGLGGGVVMRGGQGAEDGFALWGDAEMAVAAALAKGLEAVWLACKSFSALCFQSTTLEEEHVKEAV